MLPKIERSYKLSTESPQQNISCAYLFDVDGVLTNPWTKKVEKEEIFSQLQKRLEMGMMVCLNSGRAEDFLVQEILDPLKKRIGDMSLMQNVVAIGEKGGVLITYDAEGEKTVQIDTQSQVPPVVQTQIKALAQEKYYETMFYDPTKQTMITLEMKSPEQMQIAGKTYDDFMQAQKALCPDLRTILDRAGLSSQFRVDPTGIATDVESILAGKAYGVDRFTQYLRSRKVSVNRYKCFGDSRSDIEMHKRLTELGLASEFIFVGKRKQLVGESGEGVIFMANDLFDSATLQYLIQEEVM